MPELPDVACFKSYLDATSLHRKVTGVERLNAALLRDVSPAAFRKALTGHRFESSLRHGKYLFVRLDGGKHLVMHFGMTGFLKSSKHGSETPDPTQAEFLLDDGYHLAYVCQRKLGHLTVVGEPQELIERHELGPDALDNALDAAAMAERLSQSRAAVKSALMNQKLLAGIGNIYSDEILFQTRLHPSTPASDLDKATLRKLHRNMRKVLNKAIERDAKPNQLPRTYLLPHRHEDGECPRCGHPLETLKVSGRTAWLCPHCQS